MYFRSWKIIWPPNQTLSLWSQALLHANNRILVSEDLLCMFLQTVHWVLFQLALRWWHNVFLWWCWWWWIISLILCESSYWFCILVHANATVIFFVHFTFIHGSFIHLIIHYCIRKEDTWLWCANKNRANKMISGMNHELVTRHLLSELIVHFIHSVLEAKLINESVYMIHFITLNNSISN